VADKEALLIVGVDEPQRDRVGAARFDLAGLRLEDIDAFDPDPDPVVGSIAMSGSPKTTNRLPAPVFFNSPAMCRSGFMRALDRDAADPLELGGVGVEIEGAGDHHIEPRVGRLARRVDEVGALHRAEFGAKKDRRTALRPHPSLPRMRGRVREGAALDDPKIASFVLQPPGP
jgi:hypothetical protein